MAAYVRRCDNPVTSQLPDMELMNSKNTFNLQQQIILKENKYDEKYKVKMFIFAKREQDLIQIITGNKRKSHIKIRGTYWTASQLANHTYILLKFQNS